MVASSAWRRISERYDAATFPADFLLATGMPATAVKIWQGRQSRNRDPFAGTITYVDRFSFRAAHEGMLSETFDTVYEEHSTKKKGPRFLIACDGLNLRSLDTALETTLDCSLADLPGAGVFFAPLEKWDSRTSRKGAAKSRAPKRQDIAIEMLSDFYWEICENDPKWRQQENHHAMNMFIIRLLFCMFGDKTNVFPVKTFQACLTSYTEGNPEKVRAFIQESFKVMNIDHPERGDVSAWVAELPYINGGLFRDDTEIPEVTPKAFVMLLQMMGMEWQEIDPDIFGSMIQTVVSGDRGTRADLSMHYTSTENVLKIVNPSFLDRLRAEVEAADGNVELLRAALVSLGKIRAFDPTCGSGNFISVTYKELRKIENRVLGKLMLLVGDKFHDGKFVVDLNHVYGSDGYDLAVQTARLSLWISQHQMNLDFVKQCPGAPAPKTLPLCELKHVVMANSARTPWEQLFPVESGTDRYIVGNPPFRGATRMTTEMRLDFTAAFDGVKEEHNGELDLVVAWLLRAMDYVATHDVKAAFITTATIFSGTQPAKLEAMAVKRDVEIGFAWRRFKWENDAADQASLDVAIISLQRISKGPKYIFARGKVEEAEKIDWFLKNEKRRSVKSGNTPLSKDLPRLNQGHKPVSDNGLILTEAEKNKLVREYPEAVRFLRECYNAQDVLGRTRTWCLWIEDGDLEAAMSIKDISDRIDRTANQRRESPKTHKAPPHRIAEIRKRLNGARGYYLALPRTFTLDPESDYFPVRILHNTRAVILDGVNAGADIPMYVFGVLSTRMASLWFDHWASLRGGAKRYIMNMCYNTFPLEEMDDGDKHDLECRARIVHEALTSALSSGKTLTDLGIKGKMPDDLRIAREKLDQVFELMYNHGVKFESDEMRMVAMRQNYERLAAQQDAEKPVKAVKVVKAEKPVKPVKAVKRVRK